MAVTKLITLTDSGISAGPNYEISCSNDCVTYGPCITSGSIYLPSVGSQAYVEIYDTTQCIKLVNANDACNNSVIKSFIPSGSTTSTTSTSTTSTTTGGPGTLQQYTFTGGSGVTFNYKNKNSVDTTINMNTLWSPIIVCAYSNTITQTGGGTYTLKQSFCPECSRMHLVASAPNSAYATFEQYDGTPVQFFVGSSAAYDNYIDITSGSFKETYDPTNKFTETFGDCTTTTTTSTTSTTTTTFSPNPCVCMEVVVTSAGAGWDILDCYGNNQSVVAPSAGTYHSCVSVIGGLPQINVTYGTATYSQVGNCKTQSCPPPTTTTTTAASTTTTTSGTFYDIVCYGSDANDACYNSISCFSMAGNGTTFCNSTTFTSTGWYSVPTGNYVVSYLGNSLNVSHTQFTNTATVYGGGCQACPATTTTTTTTTAAPTYYYYDIYQYNCFPCSLNTTGLIGRSSTAKINGYYYNIGDGYVYLVNSSTSGPSYDVDLDGAASAGTNCNGTCSI